MALSKKPKRPPVRAKRTPLQLQVQRGLNGDATGGPVSKAIHSIAWGVSPGMRRAALRLFDTVQSEHRALLREPDATRALVNLCRFHTQWQNKPGDFDFRSAAKYRPPATDTFDGERDPPAFWVIRKLAGHLLHPWADREARWLREAWFGRQVNPILPMKWFVHLGKGKSLATAPDLPLRVTKAMSHLLSQWVFKRHITAFGALRYAQLYTLSEKHSRGRGLEGAFANFADRTRLRHPMPDEAFWESFIPWYVARADNHDSFGAIVNYLCMKKFGDFGIDADPGFSYERLGLKRLIDKATVWDGEIAWVKKRQRLRWAPLGLGVWDAPLYRFESEPRYRIIELTNASELIDEGEVLCHCVGTYARECVTRQSAIFAMRERDYKGAYVPSVTIELDLSSKSVVQAYGLQNRFVSADQERIVRRWCKEHGFCCDL